MYFQPNIIFSADFQVLLVLMCSFSIACVHICIFSMIISSFSVSNYIATAYYYVLLRFNLAQILFVQVRPTTVPITSPT